MYDPKLAIPIWIRIWLRIRIKMKVGSESEKTHRNRHTAQIHITVLQEFQRKTLQSIADFQLLYMRDKNMRILPELYLHINYNVQYVNKVSST